MQTKFEEKTLKTCTFLLTDNICIYRYVILKPKHVKKLMLNQGKKLNCKSKVINKQFLLPYMYQYLIIYFRGMLRIFQINLSKELLLQFTYYIYFIFYIQLNFSILNTGILKTMDMSK